MIKQVSSVTFFRDAVGMRMSATYSEIDEETGKIIGDNKRIDRVVAKSEDVKIANNALDLAQTFVDTIE